MLMSEFQHPHVLGLIGISLDANNSPYLLLPYMENGDLREFLKNKRGSSMSNITSYPAVRLIVWVQPTIYRIKLSLMMKLINVTFK